MYLEEIKAKIEIEKVELTTEGMCWVTSQRAVAHNWMSNNEWNDRGGIGAVNFAHHESSISPTRTRFSKWTTLAAILEADHSNTVRCDID